MGPLLLVRSLGPLCPHVSKLKCLERFCFHSLSFRYPPVPYLPLLPIHSPYTFPRPLALTALTQLARTVSRKDSLVLAARAAAAAVSAQPAHGEAGGDDPGRRC